MSVHVGRVRAIATIPKRYLDHSTIDPHVYHSRAGVELVAVPCRLGPVQARELAAMLVKAADAHDASTEEIRLRGHEVRREDPR